MAYLTSIVSVFPASSYMSCQPGDAIDRLGQKGPSAIIGFSVFLLTFKPLIWVNLECFYPKYFTSDQSEFAMQYCYSKGTYIGTDGNDMLAKWRRDWKTEENGEESPSRIRGGDRQQYIPYVYPQHGQNSKVQRGDEVPIGGSPPRLHKRISQYRIVIPTLTIICLFIQIPPLIWGALVANVGGIDVLSLVKCGLILEKMETEEEQHQLLLRNMSKELQRFMDSQRKMKSGKFFFAYIFSKFLLILIVGAQLMILSWLTKTNMVGYSLSKVSDPFRMFFSTAKANDVFPLLVYCDFPGDSQIHARFLNYSVICAMPIHILQEFILVILTLFLLLLLILVAFSIGFWLYAIHANRYQYVKLLLLQIGEPISDRKRVRLFAEEKITIDTFFVLLLMESHCGQRSLADVIAYLWKANEQSLFIRAEVEESIRDENGKPEFRLGSPRKTRKSALV